MQALLHAQHSSNIGNLLGVPSEVPMLGTYWDLVKSQYNSNILGTCWAVGPAKSQCWELAGQFPSEVPMLGSYWDLVKSQHNSNILGTCWAVGPAKTQCWELTGRFTQLSPNVGNVLDTHSNAG